MNKLLSIRFVADGASPLEILAFPEFWVGLAALVAVFAGIKLISWLIYKNKDK